MRAKFEGSKPIQVTIKRRNDSKSATKLPKTEDKMIESLKDIQSALKNKLQVIQQ